MLALQAFVVFVYARHLFLVLRGARKVRRALQESDGRTCLQCGYNLFDSPVVGHCPECGVEYEIEDVRRAWRVVFRFDDVGSKPAS